MKVTTLADGSQLQYIKVSGPVEDRWISHADSMLATNRPEHAQGFLPAEALNAYLRLVSLGYKGLSLTNALPDTDRKLEQMQMSRELMAQLRSVDEASESLIGKLDSSGSLESEHIQRAAYKLRIAVVQALGDDDRVAAARQSLRDVNDDQFLVGTVDETRQGNRT